MKYLSIALVSALVMSGCATSGQTNISASDATADSDDTYPVRKVIKDVYTQQNLSYIGDVDGIDFAFSVYYQPQGETVYDDKTVQHTLTRSVISMNEVPLYDFTSTVYYTSEPFSYQGYEMPAESYSYVTKSVEIPEYATLGSSSIYAYEDTYTDANKTNKVNSNTMSWSLSAASDDTAWLCESIESEAISDDYDYSGEACYEINKEGDILGGKAEMNSPFDPDTVLNLSIETID